MASKWEKSFKIIRRQKRKSVFQSTNIKRKFSEAFKVQFYGE